MEARTIQALRALVQGRRRDRGLSQTEAAAKAGVSRKWLSDFEAGKETVELGKVLALLDALDLVLHVDPVDKASAESDLDAILAEYRAER